MPYKAIHIFLPHDSDYYPVGVYFKGEYKAETEKHTLYIHYVFAEKRLSSLHKNSYDSNAENCIIGYSGPKAPKDLEHLKNVIIFSDNWNISKVLIEGKAIHYSSCVITLYNRIEFEKSQTRWELNSKIDSLSILQRLVKTHHAQQHCGTQEKKIESLDSGNFQWLSSFMIVQHLLCAISLLRWLQSSIFHHKRVKIKEFNYIFTIILDLVMGYYLLELLSQSKTSLASILMTTLEELVNSLSSLLKWLMGAPAGLKLNNAFNKMLGKYFTYHVQLWWLFLDVSSEKLHVVFNLYKVLGHLGITFQAAMISDLITLCSFHSYCIYVYAARLFNIQIRGLTALMRLFFGRKFNPLRNCIDSCEYSNQELFIGTVAFTILLLLLPTTTMYYAVFTLFRVLYLAIRYMLAKFIHQIQIAPIYITMLWLANSPKVGGEISLHVVKEEDGAPLVLEVKVKRKPITEMIQQFKPPVRIYRTVQWTNLLSHIFTGKQII